MAFFLRQPTAFFKGVQERAIATVKYLNEYEKAWNCVYDACLIMVTQAQAAQEFIVCLLNVSRGGWC